MITRRQLLWNSSLGAIAVPAQAQMSDHNEMRQAKEPAAQTGLPSDYTITIRTGMVELARDTAVSTKTYNG